MKRAFLALTLMLGLFVVPSFAQALSGSASNVTLANPGTAYTCVPVDGNGPGATIPFTCNGFATVLQNTTTFTSLTVTVDRPVIGSQQITVAIEDFSLGTNVVYCAITSGQKSCTASFSTAISAGDILAAKIYNNVTAPAYYNIQRISWVLQ